ncbi:hypothetical protein HYH03_010017 [Edaphochlamys debaryana]|uniref:Phospholipase B-like n=1 Tax=Edaphochlamys debaryana TaxID=47281 RepID=A0A835XXW7_9CHLO|nr:hypothetical protein HYH03_010017 [Edaphochlamys debaryana]|eukprot:KAG2491647.1 hypothetical protein HYH03_010017 [Edaphochlamys debaryana]
MVEDRATLRAEAPPAVRGYVVFDEASELFSFKRQDDGEELSEADAPAFGSFSDPVRHVSNFGQLRVTTNPAFPDAVQAQAAGFLEGYLTAERIFDYSYNMKAWLAGETNDTFKIGDWLFAQDKWARDQVAAAAAAAAGDPAAAPAPAPSPSYWPAVGLALAQSDGLLAGYSARLAEMTNAGAAVAEMTDGAAAAAAAGGGEGARGKGKGKGPTLERLTKWDFLVLNALGDMDDLMGVVFPDDKDGGETGDYDADVASGAGEGGALQAEGSRRRQQHTPNPERDSSFFFRPENPAERAARLSREAAERSDAAAGLRGARATPRRGPWEGLSPAQVRARIAKRGRCSALIKVTPNLDDLLLGHVTWWAYASMLRIYKHYDLRFTALTPGLPGDSPAGAGAGAGAGARGPNTRVSFSSYPGQITSADDWYLLGSGLVVTETSLDIYDHHRYNASYCSSASLLSWQRVVAANALATDGLSWAELAAAHNSGTYNNQYMVVDLNRFSPGQEMRPGLLTVMEIIPGMARTADATSDLAFGHWPSYNVPYFTEVYEATGYRRHADALAARGEAYAEAAAGLSYQLAPRAKIFRRDAAAASDLPSFRRLLRSNAFGRKPADPLAQASPWDALCGRGDLDPEDPDVYGCFDGKVTNYRRALALSADAINGPTTEDGQRPFAWADHPRFERLPRRGMLDVFDTQWEEQAP